MDSFQRSPSKNKLDVTWIDVDIWCRSIVIQVEKENIQLVVGIPNGGLIPGQIIAYYLNTKFLPARTKDDVKCGYADKVLVVDDVADTGMTLMNFNPSPIFNYPPFKTAVLVQKPWLKEMTSNLIRPDYFAKELSEWIVFPWER